MADAHWAASARMPSNLLLAEAVCVAEEAGRQGQHAEAQQCVVLLQHLQQCCQAYRSVSGVCLAAAGFITRALLFVRC